jgi:hypothetical protein
MNASQARERAVKAKADNKVQQDELAATVAAKTVESAEATYQDLLRQAYQEIEASVANGEFAVSVSRAQTDVTLDAVTRVAETLVQEQYVAVVTEFGALRIEW